MMMNVGRNVPQSLVFLRSSRQHIAENKIAVRR